MSDICYILGQFDVLEPKRPLKYFYTLFILVQILIISFLDLNINLCVKISYMQVRRKKSKLIFLKRHTLHHRYFMQIAIAIYTIYIRLLYYTMTRHATLRHTMSTKCIQYTCFSIRTQPKRTYQSSLGRLHRHSAQQATPACAPRHRLRRQAYRRLTRAQLCVSAGVRTHGGVARRLRRWRRLQYREIRNSRTQHGGLAQVG